VEGALIESAFTHDQARSAEVSLVIDVLRGVTTVVQALAGGSECVLWADNLRSCACIGGARRVLAGPGLEP
jgi:phosphosulfolactate phosphohydrolase-like enzyme